MNSIKQVTSGLASSLFLAAGFTSLAEKMDPTSSTARNDNSSHSAVASAPTVLPCYFTPQTGK